MENNKLTIEQVKKKGTLIKFPTDSRVFKSTGFTIKEELWVNYTYEEGDENITIFMTPISEFYKHNMIKEEPKYTVEFLKNNKIAIKVESLEQIEKIKEIVKPLKPCNYTYFFKECCIKNVALNDEKYDLDLYCDNYLKTEAYKIIDYQTFIEHNKQETMEKLPAKWAVKGNYEISEKAIEYFQENLKASVGFYESHYYHSPLHNGICSNGKIHEGYTEISLETFKKYILKEETMEEKKIIGYKSPFAITLDGFLAQKDTLFIADANAYCPKGKQGNGTRYYLPKEIVEQWEKVYEDEIKVGDILYVEKYIESISQIGDIIEVTTLGTNSQYRYLVNYKNLKTGKEGRFGYSHYIGSFRKATPEEIKAAKTITVSMGDFNVVVRDGKIFHEGSDISNYVTSVNYWWEANKKQKFASYDFHIKDVVLEKVGCQKGTKMSDWTNLYKIWKENK